MVCSRYCSSKKPRLNKIKFNVNNLLLNYLTKEGAYLFDYIKSDKSSLSQNKITIKYIIFIKITSLFYRYRCVTINSTAIISNASEKQQKALPNLNSMIRCNIVCKRAR